MGGALTVHMLAQAPPRPGGDAWITAHNKCTAQEFFELANALGHSERRHVQRGRCALEAARADYGDQNGHQAVVRDGQVSLAWMGNAVCWFHPGASGASLYWLARVITY
jgi:hypothetical protein